MFDMRTILLLTISYSLISGLVIILFSLRRRQSLGLKSIGIGIMVNGVGFFILSQRDLLNDFMTVIVANYAIFIGVAIILSGFTAFRRLNIQWRYQHILLSLIFFIGFYFMTYRTPNIRGRIILITLLLLIQFCELVFVIFRESQVRSLVENIALVFFYLASILIFITRIIITLNEAEMVSFMTAGDIHTLSVVIFQVMPFVLVITTFWISNSTMEDKLLRLSMTDGLTNLYNRVAILEIAAKSLDTHKRATKPLGIAMCDVDHFKDFNDTYGHQVGDQVLIEVSQILQEHLRFGDYVGRYGGEEFILIINAIDQEDLLNKLEHLRWHVENIKFKGMKESIHVTMSFGGYIVKGECPLDQAIDKADQALYKAKADGRNLVRIFTDS